MTIQEYNFDYICSLMQELIDLERDLYQRLGQGKSKALMISPAQIQEYYQKIMQQYRACNDQLNELKMIIKVDTASFDIISRVKEEMDVRLNEAHKQYQISLEPGNTLYIGDVMDWILDYCARNYADQRICVNLLNDLRRLSVGYPSNFEVGEPGSDPHMLEVYAPPEYMGGGRDDKIPIAPIYAPPEFMDR